MSVIVENIAFFGATILFMIGKPAAAAYCMAAAVYFNLLKKE